MCGLASADIPVRCHDPHGPPRLAGASVYVLRLLPSRHGQARLLLLPGSSIEDLPLKLRGRRVPGIGGKWHMDVPRPRVRTGRPPERCTRSPGRGGPVRSKRPAAAFGADFGSWRRYPSNALPRKAAALRPDSTAPNSSPSPPIPPRRYPGRHVRRAHVAGPAGGRWSGQSCGRAAAASASAAASVACPESVSRSACTLAFAPTWLKS